MPKPLLRIVAVLLIPCLLADSAFSAVGRGMEHSFARAPTLAQFRFQDQALSPVLVGAQHWSRPFGAGIVVVGILVVGLLTGVRPMTAQKRPPAPSGLQIQDQAYWIQMAASAPDEFIRQLNQANSATSKVMLSSIGHSRNAEFLINVANTGNLPTVQARMALLVDLNRDSDWWKSHKQSLAEGLKAPLLKEHVMQANTLTLDLAGELAEENNADFKAVLRYIEDEAIRTTNARPLYDKSIQRILNPPAPVRQGPAQTPLAQALWLKLAPKRVIENKWAEAWFTAILEWLPRLAFVGGAAWKALHSPLMDFQLLIVVNAALSMLFLYVLHDWVPVWAAKGIRPSPVSRKTIRLAVLLLSLDISAAFLIISSLWAWAVPVVFVGWYFHARHDQAIFNERREIRDLKSAIPPVSLLAARRRKVQWILAAIFAGLLTLHVLLRATLGVDVWSWYLTTQSKGGLGADLLSGMTAVAFGAGAQWAGMAMSDTETRRDKLNFGFTLMVQMTWRFILGWSTARYYGWVDHHFFTPIPRALVALAFGLFMSALYSYPVFIGLNRFDAWRRERKGDKEGAAILRRSIGWPDQALRIFVGIVARFPPAYLQQYLTQNVVTPAERIITLFSLGFLNNTFRSRVEFSKNARQSPWVVFFAGVSAAQIFFFWLSPSSGWLTLFFSVASAAYFQWAHTVLHEFVQGRISLEQAQRRAAVPAEAFLNEKFTALILRQIVSSGFLAPHYAEYYNRFGAALNPNRKKLFAVAGGGGPSIADLYLLCRYTKALVIDLKGVDPKRLEKYRVAWPQYFKTDAYIDAHRRYGYSHTEFVERDSELCVVRQLQAMGVRQEDVDPIFSDLYAGQVRTVLRFKLPGDRVATEVGFLQRDMNSLDERLKTELSGNVDVFVEKAFKGQGKLLDSRARVVNDWIRDGGSVLVSSWDMDRQEDGIKLNAAPIFSSLGFGRADAEEAEVWEQRVLDAPDGPRSRYGWSVEHWIKGTTNDPVLTLGVLEPMLIRAAAMGGARGVIFGSTRILGRVEKDLDFAFEPLDPFHPQYTTEEFFQNLTLMLRKYGNFAAFPTRPPSPYASIVSMIENEERVLLDLHVSHFSKSIAERILLYCRAMAGSGDAIFKLGWLDEKDPSKILLMFEYYIGDDQNVYEEMFAGYNAIASLIDREDFLRAWAFRREELVRRLFTWLDADLLHLIEKRLAQPAARLSTAARRAA